MSATPERREPHRMSATSPRHPSHEPNKEKEVHMSINDPEHVAALARAAERASQARQRRQHAAEALSEFIRGGAALGDFSEALQSAAEEHRAERTKPEEPDTIL